MPNRLGDKAVNIRNSLKTTLAAVGLAVFASQASAVSYNYTNQTGPTFDSGGSFSKTISHGMGAGYADANVQISGWDLNFVHSDHHIDRVKLFITNKYYNRTTGYVTFTIQGAYQDKNYDDDFYWNVQYTIHMSD